MWPKISAWFFSASVAALVLGACVTKQSETEQAVAQTRGSSDRVIDLTLGVRYAPRPDDFISKKYPKVSDGEKVFLPKWKTKWERTLERLHDLAKTQGNPLADIYSDYRDNNFDKFFITKPPTTTGIRSPAEYEASQAMMLTWIQYTSSATDWEKMFGEIVKAAVPVVPVLLLYEHATHKLFLETKLLALGYTSADLADPTKFIWYQHDLDAIWVRDYGPVSIVEVGSTGLEKLSFVDFRYYYARMYDDCVPSDLAKSWGINVFRPDLDYEGGNFMNTSDGLCAASKGVLWDNLQFSQSAVEKIFTDYLGCKKVMFPAPMTGDIIPHIDMFSKFASDATMMMGEYTTVQDPKNKLLLDANATMFNNLTTPGGKTMVVTRIPMPSQTGSGASMVWRTYTNSLSLYNGTTGVVLVPTYTKDTTYETQALAVYASLYPGWTIAKIDSEIIIPGQGATHCITMQIPKGVKAKMETDPTNSCGATKWVCTKGSCGNISTKGCCEGELLKYCYSGKLYAMDCTYDPKCGWDSTNSWYDCGTTGGSDTSGTYVKNCGVLTDAAVPDSKLVDAKVDTGPVSCGKIPYQGCCEGDTVYYCESSVLKSLNCATGGYKCGWDSTNKYYDCKSTATGADPSGTYPLPCSYYKGDGGIYDKGPTKDIPTGCGSITNQGCCSGETLKYCENNAVKTLDCTSNPKCGWDATNKYYDCGTSGGADPNNKYPKSCPGTGPDSTIPDSAVVDQSVATPDQVTLDKAATDGVKTDGGPEKKDDDSGCGCRVGAAPPASGLPLSLLFALVGMGAVLVTRRRR